MIRCWRSTVCNNYHAQESAAIPRIFLRVSAKAATGIFCGLWQTTHTWSGKWRHNSWQKCCDQVEVWRLHQSKYLLSSNLTRQRVSRTFGKNLAGKARSNGLLLVCSLIRAIMFSNYKLRWSLTELVCSLGPTGRFCKLPSLLWDLCWSRIWTVRRRPYGWRWRGRCRQRTLCHRRGLVHKL